MARELSEEGIGVRKILAIAQTRTLGRGDLLCSRRIKRSDGCRDRHGQQLKLLPHRGPHLNRLRSLEGLRESILAHGIHSRSVQQGETTALQYTNLTGLALLVDEHPQ